ncbi:hypothetical protein Pla52o_39960 [Novipirellula galeiformis]|uniref:Uncharacterized protein n=1 Tax=Novipirellula galeiformis TaxID=2528004 RepID=A0A5C6CC02_9BACT|nr:hypothetical protein Pla52o_39960 [Novipirellula galeiformis]
MESFPSLSPPFAEERDAMARRKAISGAELGGIGRAPLSGLCVVAVRI